MPNTPSLDHLKQIQELNRSFLGLLQSRVRADRRCLGLPVAVRPVMRVASPVLLDAVAVFPRALFRLGLASRAQPEIEDVRDAHYDEAEHDLSLSILFAARHVSRQSTYQARLLLGLETVEVQRLCALLLPDLQRLACPPGLLRCAFPDRRWFWHGLFSATRPESRRQLTLMALQPGISLDWPQRRPPQPSA
jgi:hypothetical protein